MKTLCGKVILVLVWAAALAAAAPDSQGSALDSLTEKISAAGTQAGVSRYAVEDFALEDGALQEEALQARSELAQLLLARPGTGVMDASVLSGIGGARPWPQAVLRGTLYGSGAAGILVIRLSDLKGRRLGTWQIELPSGQLPAGLRDAPGPVTPCEKKRRALLAENRDSAELKARYWAARIRSPGFSYGDLERAPGSEIKEYAPMQRFYKHLNSYHSQDGPVRLTEEEKARVEDIFRNEAAYSAECAKN